MRMAGWLAMPTETMPEAIRARRRKRRVLARIWAHYGPVPAWLRYTT